jgi:exodeoxyribonuclease VII small subunit
MANWSLANQTWALESMRGDLILLLETYASGPSVPSVRSVHWTPGQFCHSIRVVPSPSKTVGQNNPAKAGAVPFDEALKKLEAIVAAMESEDLPLETLLSKYEEGTQLARICQEKLAEAEVRVQQLEKTASGEMKLRPLPPPESPAA